MMSEIDLSNVPSHLAIIMDGNRRWARKSNFLITDGHKVGASKIKEVVTYANSFKIKYLTLFAFSCENWQRDTIEVNAILELINIYLYGPDIEYLLQNNVKLKIIGEISRFEDKIIQRIQELEKQTINNSGIVLIIALNYSGRSEIIRATKKIAEKVLDNNVKISDIDEKLFTTFLDLPDIPCPDLLIRP